MKLPSKKLIVIGALVAVVGTTGTIAYATTRPVSEPEATYAPAEKKTKVQKVVKEANSEQTASPSPNVSASSPTPPLVESASQEPVVPTADEVKAAAKEKAAQNFSNIGGDINNQKVMWVQWLCMEKFIQYKTGFADYDAVMSLLDTHSKIYFDDPSCNARYFKGIN